MDYIVNFLLLGFVFMAVELIFLRNGWGVWRRIEFTKKKLLKNRVGIILGWGLGVFVIRG